MVAVCHQIGTDLFICWTPAAGRSRPAAACPFDLLGTVLRDPAKGMTVEVRPATEAPDEEQDVFSRPARSATEIALQAALGFATADLPLVERVFHWPT